MRCSQEVGSLAGCLWHNPANGVGDMSRVAQIEDQGIQKSDPRKSF